jgi:hypothetical protein
MAGTVTLATPEPHILHTYSCLLTYTTTSGTADVQLPVEWGEPDNIIQAMSVTGSTQVEVAFIASYDTATGIATVDRRTSDGNTFVSAGAFNLTFIWYRRLPGGAQ